MAKKRTVPPAKRSLPPVPPVDAAARQRIQQRRRRDMMAKVRRFEAVLPDAPAGRGRIPLPQVGGWPLWRLLRSRALWLMAAAAAVVLAMLVWVHSDERWFLYTEDATFTGLTYLERGELWNISGIDGWNVFWLDTAGVEQRLVEHPYVADAAVHVAPLIGKVVVDIVEARPAALWVTDNGTLWLLEDGTALEPRGATPVGLLEIFDRTAEGTAPGAPLGSAIEPDVLASAQSLLERLPGVAPLRFNREIGLNFRLPDQPYWVYWGDGANVERKLENLAAGQQLLAEGKVEGEVIDVRFDRPYVK
jgi:hypothetical protein